MIKQSDKTLQEKIIAVSMLLFFFLIASLIFQKIYLQPLISMDDDIQLNLKKGAKVESIKAREKELKDIILTKRKQLNKYQIFLKNNKPSTASSELQNKIKRIIVSKSKAKILTIKPHPSVKFDSYTETSIEIRMKSIGHVGIKRILYAIESSATAFIIKELDIKRTQLRYKTLVKQATKAENLEVVLVVGAFYRGVSQ